MDNQRGIKFKIIIIWLAILLMGSFWLTLRTGSDQMSLAVLPEVPRQGEPIVTTLKLYNPSPQATDISYQLYANGEPVKEGITTLSPNSSKVYQYAYENPLPLGEQVNFMAKTYSPRGNFEQMVSLPSYPPQIWSSFVSFASFSTSMMGFMSSMTYYSNTLGSNIRTLNLGLFFTIVLAALLIFLELSQPLLHKKTIPVLRRLRLRFSTVTGILFIIFMGIFFTSILMTIAAI